MKKLRQWVPHTTLGATVTKEVKEYLITNARAKGYRSAAHWIGYLAERCVKREKNKDRKAKSQNSS